MSGNPSPWLRRRLRMWLLALCGLAAGTLAQELAAVPPLSGRVIDQTGTLSAAQHQAMEQHLANVEREIGSQIVVLMVPTTQPEDIAAYTQRVGDAWKIGRRDVGDGLLIVVAKNDRKVRIAPAKALEGAVPDLAAHQIITETITPAFRRNDFAGGLNAAIDRIAARIKPEGLPAPDAQPQRGGDGGFDIGNLLMFFFVGVPIVGAMLSGVFGRKLGALLTGGGAGALAWLLGAGLLLAGAAAVAAILMVGVFGIGGGRGRGGPPIIWGGGGGGWGGGGGGGFSSGGGGDFGGGGASGDW